MCYIGMMRICTLQVNNKFSWSGDLSWSKWLPLFLSELLCAIHELLLIFHFNANKLLTSDDIANIRRIICIAFFT